MDSLSGLESPLQDIDAKRCAIFARTAASHDTVHQDLSTRFGAMTDEMPARVDLPADIAAGDYIEFGSMDANSLSVRTGFYGFFSDDVVTIEASDSLPPSV